MSDPKKDQKPTPLAAAISSTEELAKAKLELAELEAKQELSKVKLRIESLKNDGKSPASLARIREMEAKRAKTHTFEVEGKKFAKYQTKELRFHNGVLVSSGVMVDFPYEQLPGDSLLPVVPKKASDKESFEAEG